MARRGRGEGSFRQRKDGTWEWRGNITDPVTGQTSVRSLYGSTQKEAREKLREVRRRVEEGKPATDSRMSVGQWCQQWADTWLEASTRPRETAKELYRIVVRKHIAPSALGALPLGKVRPSDIEKFILDLRQGTTSIRVKGKVEKQRRPLAESSILRIFTVLRVALNIAVRDGLLGANPAKLVDPPTVRRTEARFLTTTQVKKLISHARASGDLPLIATIAATGIRKGEALALTWDDIDFAKSAITINSTLVRVGGALADNDVKTLHSRRRLHMSQALASVLTEHRAKQEAARAKAGDAWTETGRVFTTEHGTPIDPRNALRTVRRLGDKIGVSDLNVHMLRHSAATALLEQGTHIRAVADTLGHADIRTTGNIYSHVSEPAHRKAMDGLSDNLGL